MLIIPYTGRFAVTMRYTMRLLFLSLSSEKRRTCIYTYTLIFFLYSWSRISSESYSYILHSIFYHIFQYLITLLYLLKLYINFQVFQMATFSLVFSRGEFFFFNLTNIIRAISIQISGRGEVLQYSTRHYSLLNDHCTCYYTARVSIPPLQRSERLRGVLG